MCDVVFITPNIDGEMGSEAMGTLQLTSILQENGINCDILQFFRIGDLTDFPSFTDNALRMIEERKPKIVSFYTRCDVYHIDLKLAQLIKARWNDIYIVCGGPQSDITADETLRQISYVDFICCGEGEATIYPFFSSLLAGTPDLSIPGLVYRKDGEVKKNPRPQLIEDLDSLPMLNYSLFKYAGDGMKRYKYFPIEVGRGCPFGCTFCSTNSFWGRKYRLKSPKRIYLEIKDAHDRYGITKFKFTHDMFTLNRSKVIETCDLLRSLDFKVTWGGSSRIDCIDPEMIDIMADSGLEGLFLGIETGSPRMQKLINKNLDLEKGLEITKYLESKGIGFRASFMYGFPEETEEDISLTIAYMGKLLRLKGVSIAPHLCAFFVGTELTRKYGALMTPVDYYSNQTGDFAVEDCKDLIQAHPSLFLHMYEYKTELRSKLKYFEYFIATWQAKRPVYRFISEHYVENRLIDMYYDFVEANKELLSQLPEVSAYHNTQLIREDKLLEKFRDDEWYTVASEVNRFYQTNLSDAVANGETVSAVFNVNPFEKVGVPLQEYKRCVTAVTWSNHKVSYKIFPYSI